MFNLRSAKSVLVGGLVVAVCLIGTASAFGARARVACGPRPSAGPVAVCPGPCVCVPMSPWGYYERQWRPWPGGECRQDVVFPQSIGIERLAVPRAERPKPLPREQYTKQKTKAELDAEKNTNIRILEGAPLEPVETPIPFEYVPGANNPNSEGPDVQRQGATVQ